MSGFKKFLLSPYYIYFILFMIAFCLFSILIFEAGHSLYIFSILFAPIILILQQYRKKLIKKSNT